MILLLLMLFIIFYLLNTRINDKTLRSKLIRIFFVALCVQAFLLIVYRLDLSHLGRTVYYSDAEAYWNATIKILNGDVTLQFNKTYYYTCALIQKLSPFVWVGWNNIFNLLAVDLSVLLLAVEMEKVSRYTRKMRANGIILFVSLSLFNPFVLYALFRNLKDAEFLLLSVLLLTGISDMIYGKPTLKNYLFFFAKSAISLLLIMNIRPWGFLAFAIPIIMLLFFKNRKKRLSWWTFGVLIPFIVILFLMFKTRIIGTLNIWVPIVLNSARNKGLGYFLIGFFKLFLGPGPIRCINGSKYFMFYTISGNYMTFIGSCMWLLQFGVVLSALIREKRIPKLDVLSLELLLYFLIYSVIYVFQYGGGAELRVKAPLYIIVSCLTLMNIKKIKKVDVCGALILFIAMLVASVIWGI